MHKYKPLSFTNTATRSLSTCHKKKRVHQFIPFGSEPAYALLVGSRQISVVSRWMAFGHIIKIINSKKLGFSNNKQSAEYLCVNAFVI